MGQGNIIFLNGTSSSRKTSIVKCLQEILDDPYLHFSVDTFVFMLPEKYLNQTDLPKVGSKVISCMHHCIAAAVSLGNNVIVDHVLENQDWLTECVEMLSDFPVLFVGVRCPIEEVERRERDRGDRQVGLARWQLGRVHAHEIYDFEVDTSIYNPMECALQIKEALQESPFPRAFTRLKKTLK